MMQRGKRGGHEKQEETKGGQRSAVGDDADDRCRLPVADILHCRDEAGGYPVAVDGGTAGGPL